MRITLVMLALAAVLSAMPVRHALAGASDQEKIGKIVRKYAYSGGSVFADNFKPKAICHCHDGGARLHKAGILVTTNGLDLLCAIPTTITNGELSVVDFGCVDFDIIGK